DGERRAAKLHRIEEEEAERGHEDEFDEADGHGFAQAGEGAAEIEDGADGEEREGQRGRGGGVDGFAGDAFWREEFFAAGNQLNERGGDDREDERIEGDGADDFTGGEFVFGMFPARKFEDNNGGDVQQRDRDGGADGGQLGDAFTGGTSAVGRAGAGLRVIHEHGQADVHHVGAETALRDDTDFVLWDAAPARVTVTKKRADHDHREKAETQAAFA